jgi:hypothetical protein
MENPDITSKLAKDFEKVKLGIRRFKEAGLYHEGIQILHMISLKSFDFELAIVERIAHEDLLTFLVSHRCLNIFQLQILSQLLALKGEIYFKQRSFPFSKNCFEKSSIILLHVDKQLGEQASAFFVEYLASNTEMIRKIKGQFI